jgi:hypothetical protein
MPPARLQYETLALVLDLLSLTNPPAKIVGSYSLSEHQYPSDIDAFHTVGAVNKKWTPAQIALGFANVVRQLHQYGQSGESVVFLDFKCGYHPNWLPLLKDGQLKKIPTVLPPDVSESQRQEWSHLKEEKLLEAMRHHYTIRWKPEEILAGYKRLPGGPGVASAKLTLAEAIAMGTVTKIDTAIWLTGEDRWVSVEVWYNLIGYTSMPQYRESLLADIKKFAHEPKKALKLLKRTWLYLRAIDQNTAANLITPILSGKEAVLNQVAADCEVLLGIYTAGIPRSHGPGEESRSSLTEHDQARMVLTDLSFRRRLTAVLPVSQVDKILANVTGGFDKYLESVQDHLKSQVAAGAAKFYAKIKPDLLEILQIS